MTIPFNREQFKRLMDGYKFATVRRGIKHVTPGPNIAACGDAMAVINVTEVKVKFFKDIDRFEADLEGYGSFEDMIRVIKDIYPDIKPLDVVSVIVWDRVSAPITV